MGKVLHGSTCLALCTVLASGTTAMRNLIMERARTKATTKEGYGCSLCVVAARLLDDGTRNSSLIGRGEHLSRRLFRREKVRLEAGILCSARIQFTSIVRCRGTGKVIVTGPAFRRRWMEALQIRGGLASDPPFYQGSQSL
jgi:hypothetical protein